jgi:hypothetical protein
VPRLSSTRVPGPHTEPAAADRSPARAPDAGRRVLAAGRSLWALAGSCVVLGAISLAVPSTPTYDPWAWIIWGREITQLDLNTNFGPSWKPLPVLFTTLFAPFGDAAPELWLVVARAGGLLALALTFRLARRLVGGGAAGAFAGALALAGLLLSPGFLRNVGLGNSEGLLVAFALLAIERHLDGARSHAFAAAFAAALLRPEIWPFLGVYAILVWRAEPRARRLVAALLALVPVLWFGPELWGSGDPLRASSRARDPNAGSPAFAERPALEILRLTEELLLSPVILGALLALALAGIAFARARRGRTPLVVGAAAAAWVALVAAMTEAGYAGNPRYLVLAVAGACVLAGVGLASVARGAAGLVRDVSGREPLALAAGVAAAVAIVAASAASAREAATGLEAQYGALRAEGILYRDLTTAVERAGGRHAVLACGRPITGPYHVPALAWRLHVHSEIVTMEPETPGIVFSERDDRTLVLPADAPFRHVAAAGEWDVLAACAP